MSEVGTVAWEVRRAEKAEQRIADLETAMRHAADTLVGGGDPATVARGLRLMAGTPPRVSFEDVRGILKTET